MSKEAMAQQEPTTLFETFDQFGEGWERLAWELCAEEHGEDACSELIWEGGPIPEPWGDRWLKYEDEAKRLIALVRKCATPQAQQKPVEKDAYEWGDRLNNASWAAVKAWDENIMGPMSGAVFNNIKGVVRAAILTYLDGKAAHGIKE